MWQITENNIKKKEQKKILSKIFNNSQQKPNIKIVFSFKLSVLEWRWIISQSFHMHSSSNWSILS